MTHQGFLLLGWHGWNGRVFVCINPWIWAAFGRVGPRAWWVCSWGRPWWGCLLKAASPRNCQPLGNKPYLCLPLHLWSRIRCEPDGSRSQGRTEWGSTLSQFPPQNKVSRNSLSWTHFMPLSSVTPTPQEKTKAKIEYKFCDVGCIFFPSKKCLRAF